MDTIRALQQFAPELNNVVFFITNLGSQRAYIIFLLVTYLAIDARVGRYLGVALLSSFYLNFTLKGIIDTPRPYVLEPDLSLGAQYDATGTGPGFPSGHAQGSATFWGLAAVYARRIWFWLIAIILTVLIALSRLYLGVHLPVDAVGGVIIGALVIGLFLGVVGLTQDLRWPLALILALGILAPLVIHLSVPRLLPTISIPESDLLMGALAAFFTGPLLLPHRVSGTWWQRGLLALLGCALVFAFLLGSSAFLPEFLKRDAVVGFVRYLLLGYTGVLLTPWLGKRLGLVSELRT